MRMRVRPTADAHRGNVRHRLLAKDFPPNHIPEQQPRLSFGQERNLGFPDKNSNGRQPVITLRKDEYRVTHGGSIE